MNAHRHRLVFNRARGLVMAVAEIACARGKNPANGGGPAVAAPPGFKLAKLRPAAFAVLLAAGAQLAIVPLADAQVVAYKAAPTSQQPTVLQAGNGVPLVNIQTPSAAGVSRNTYAQFDVQTQGAILNNSRGNVQTQLGGWVQGNPWLARGSARVILNEVVSANPSQLLGYVEVAGAPAQVVIANPAGVTCNGCGFINASRATLTTGTPIVSGGNLDGYRVDGGTIRIDGAGMDASRVGYTDLIARAVEVNAGLWAQTLKVTAGANTVDASNSQATPIPGSGPTPVSGYSIDVAQLGGMYAGKITLVGTEAGVGVRNAGTLGASAGEVVVTVDGRLINRGDLLATANVELAAQGIDNSGKIGAQHNVVIRNRGDLANTGAIVGARELILATTGKLTNDGGSLEAQRLDLDAGDLDNLRGKIRQTGSQALAIDTRTLANRNDGVIGRMPLTGGDTGGGTNGGTNGGTSGGTNGETSTTTGTTVIPATPVLLADGRIAVSGAIANDGGDIVANGGTSLASHAGFDNRARIDVDQLTTRGSFANAGGRIAAQRADIDTGRLDNRSGDIVVHERLDLKAHDVANAGGSLQLTGNADLAVHLAGNLDNSAGRIASNGANLTLEAATLANADGRIEHAGSGTFTVSVDTLAGTRGRIVSNGMLALTAHSATLDAGDTAARTLAIRADALSNQGGRIAQTGDGEAAVRVAGRLDNRGGSIASRGGANLGVGELANEGGTIDSVGALRTDVTRHLDNASGRIVAGTDLALAAASANNTDGTLGAIAGKLTATVAGTLDNTNGRIEAATDLTLANDGLVNAGGTVFGKTLAVDTRRQALDNRSGRFIAEDTLDLHSGALDNAAGLIQAGGALSVDTHGQRLANTASGEAGGILGQKTVTLKAGAFDNAAGFVGAREALVITADTLASTAGGRLVGETDVALTARQIDHRGGKTQAAGALTVRAAESIDNAGGLLRAGGALELAAASLGNADTLGTDQGIEGRSLTVTANAIDNRRGAMRADTTLVLTSSGTVGNSGGLISSAQTVAIRDAAATKTLAVTNTGGTLIAGRQLDIDAASLTGDGKLLSRGDLAVTLAADYTHSGELTANGRAGLSTAGTLTNTAKLQAGSRLALTAATLDNRAGGEILAPELRLAATDTHTLINRGLIDGTDTRLDAITLNNLGSGRIYGDHLAIAATTLNNHAEGGTAPVIATRNRLDLGVGTLSNRDGALIFSAGDMAIGGALDANRLTTGRAGTVLNASADIEALGNFRLDAARLENRDTRFSSAFVDTGAVAVQEYQNYGSPYRYAANQVTTYLAKPNSDQWVLYLRTPTETSNNWYRYNYTRRITETVVLDSRAASITAGNALSIRADAVVNDKSRLVAGGDLTVSAGSIDNLSAAGQRTETASGTATRYYRNRRSSGLPDQGIQTGAYNPAPVVEAFSLAAAVYGGHQAVQGSGFAAAGQAAGSVGQSAAGAAGAETGIGSGQRADRGASAPPVAGNVAPVAPRIVRVDLPVSVTGPARAVATVDAPVRLPANRLFRQNPDPAARVLVETDPRFADHRQWLSSDTMLKALALDPATTQKRLGDGFYEQRLITEQVGQLTGRRFLAGFDNDETQYRALMSAGVAFAKEWQLVPGVALSAEQMARLTSDIVWLVEKTVTLADGSVQKALVPQVYARVRDGDLAPSGALIAGRNLDLAAAGQLVNEGAIAGSGRVSLAATDLVNRGGLVAGREVALAAERDLDHRGGLIAAEDRLSLAAGRNIVVASDTYRSEAAGGSREGIARLATLYARGPGATLDVGAGGDLTLSAARVEAGAATLGAGGDLRLTAVSERSTEALIDRRASRTQTDMRDLGSRIETRGDLVLQAGGDLALDAARLTAGGTLAAQAGGELSVRAGRERSDIAGRLGRASVAIGREGVVAGELTGERVALAAASDLTVAGSRVTAAQDMTLAAGGDLSLATASERTRNDWEKGDGRNWRRESSSREVGSTLAAGGDLRLAAGGDLTARAADVTSAQGAVVASAGRDLTIEAGEAAYRLDQASYRKSGRKKTTTVDTIDTTTAVTGTFSGDSVTLIADRDLAVTGGDILATRNVALSAGRDLAIDAATETRRETHFVQTKKKGSFSKKSKTTRDALEDTRVVASTVTGESVTLVAGQDLAVRGSNVAATNDMTLAAGRDLALAAAVETHRESHSVEKKKSGAFSSTFATTNKTRDEVNAKGSIVSAGRDLALIAGAANAEAASGEGNLTLHGSAVDAGRDLSIQTTGDLQLLAAYSQSRETTQRTKQTRKKLETLDFELEQNRVLLSTLTAGNGIDLNVRGNLAAQIGSTDTEGRLQADRMTASGVLRGEERQQVSLTHTDDKKGTTTNGPTSKVLGDLAAQGIRSGAADSFDPEAVQSGQTAVTALLQSGLVSVRNQPGVQAALNAPTANGAALTYQDASGKVSLTLAGQAKVQAVYNQLKLTETFDVKHFADQGTAQVVTLVAAIALTVMSGGTGAAMIGAAAGTTSAAVANAAFIAMASTMTGQLAGGASFGDAFQAGLKAGTTSAITAGILNAPVIDTAQGMQSINQLANVQTTGANIVGNFNADTFGQNLLGIGARGVVNAGVSSAIYGGSFGDAFKASVVGDLAAVGANAVGQGTQALSLGNILGHAAVGCAAAAANGKDCASGAIGGAGAAVMNPVLDQAIGGADGSGWGGTPETAQQWQTATLQLGSMAASAAAAAALGKDGMTAALAAQNETVNNFLTKENIQAKQARLAAAKTPEERAAIVKEFIGVSTDNRNKALANVNSVMTVAELEAARDNLATLVSGPTACNASPSCRADVRNGISEINGILASARAGEKMEPVVLAAEAVLTLATAGEYLVARNALRAGAAGAEAFAGDVANIVASETQVFAKFAENAANRTYRNLDLAINEHGLLAQERSLAEAAGWKRADGSTWWPPYDGAIPGTQRIILLEPGSAGSVNLVDRFGRTAGTYVSPAGLSLESRALSYTPATPPSMYSVDAAIGGVERSTIAPWFGQKGLGVQYKLPNSVQYYLDTKKLGEMK